MNRVETLELVLEGLSARREKVIARKDDTEVERIDSEARWIELQLAAVKRSRRDGRRETATARRVPTARITLHLSLEERAGLEQMADLPCEPLSVVAHRALVYGLVEVAADMVAEEDADLKEMATAAGVE